MRAGGERAWGGGTRPVRAVREREKEVPRFKEHPFEVGFSPLASLKVTSKSRLRAVSIGFNKDPSEDKQWREYRGSGDGCRSKILGKGLEVLRTGGGLRPSAPNARGRGAPGRTPPAALCLSRVPAPDRGP